LGSAGVNQWRESVVNKNERRWIVLFSAITLLVTTIPYIVGFWTQRKDWVYTGFVFGLDDGNSYLSKMLRGAAGDWLFRTPYTAYPQRGMVGFLPYLLLGKLTAPPDQHVQLVALFHGFRIATGFLVILATYVFIAHFIRDVGLRRFGTALAILGGGLGWISILGANKLFHWGMPLEFYSPETFGFLSIFGLPHLAAARGLLYIGLLVYLRAKDWKKAALYGGGAWLLMGLFQPLTIVVGWGVIAAHLAILGILSFIQPKEKRAEFRKIWIDRVKPAISIGLVSSPMVIYNYLVFKIDPFLKGWLTQNIISSPPLLDYLFAYFLFLPLAILAFFSMAKKRDSQYLLIAVWIPLALILVYIPYNLQRRLAEGSWTAWVTMGLIGLTLVPDTYSKWIKRFLWTAFLPAVILFAGGLSAVLQPQRPLFLSRNITDSFNSLGAIAQRDDVVLASFELSNYIPAWLPVRTVTGHGPESVNLKDITADIQKFYQLNAAPDESRQFLSKYDIRYVFLTPDEMKIGNIRRENVDQWEPVKAGTLKVIYNQDDVILFQVELP
jgi:predicted membrane protein